MLVSSLRLNLNQTLGAGWADFDALSSNACEFQQFVIQMWVFLQMAFYMVGDISEVVEKADKVSFVKQQFCLCDLVCFASTCLYKPPNGHFTQA